MSPRPAPTARRLVPALAAVLAAISISACGIGDKHKHPVYADVNKAASSGLYVDAGPITYQVQISRVLNPYSTEDKSYLVGLPAGEAQLTAGEDWFGVFIWAKNQSKRTASTTSTFTITDTQGTTYYPISLDTQNNLLAYKPQQLAPGTTAPGPNSQASNSATQGEELLFKVNSSIYANRPLTLNIKSPGATTAQVQLDL